MPSHIAERADFSYIRYAQCWEDADVLLEGLGVGPGDVCLSIASAGDNTLALLARDPARVVAIDLSAAQIACLELRVAAYRCLAHRELLELLGSRPSAWRLDFYRRCRPLLSPSARAFWDARPAAVAGGIAAAGKFERYLRLFRTFVLPMVHPRDRVERLLAGGSRADREAFYETAWNTCRWRLALRTFFSRAVMGRLGRDPSFFAFAEGDMAAHVARRVRHALTVLDPAENPYAHWILTGRHREALPFALRAENFEAIRARLDRLEIRRDALDDFLETSDARGFDAFNLSDVFEYMPPEAYHATLERLLRAARPKARLAYWNLLATRTRPPEAAERLRPLTDLSRALHARDKAFFYKDFVVEEVAA